MKKIIDQLIKLQNKLFYYDYIYHTLNKSEIPDTEYDCLIKKLKKIESQYPELITPNSSTQRVGSIILNNLKKNLHKTPMLSLDNIFDNKSFLQFNEKLKKILKNQDIFYCCELKLDGIAINLLYEKNSLIFASTRGDGNIGENITKKIKGIISIPLFLKGENIPKSIEIRGELFVRKSIFLKFNNTRLFKNKKKFSNTRSLTAGILRHTHINKNIKKNLSFSCHGIGFFEGVMPEDHFSRLQLLKNWGMPLQEDIKICKNEKEVLEFFSYSEKKRSKLDFDIDGIVIKVNSTILQKKLGCNTHAPRWAIAFKFPSKKRTTYIKKIDFQVGRTGIITPIANFDPVLIGGTTIQRATLHNFNEIKRLNLSIGSKVIVERSGDVIPKIISVIFSSKIKDIKKIVFPIKCPICKSSIKYFDNQAIAKCIGKMKCNMQLILSLLHFVSKNAMNIEGIGYKLIKKLVDSKKIKNIVDLFLIDIKTLIKVNGMGDKLAFKIIKSINLSKKTTLSKFIYALGIRYIGRSMSEKISMHFKELKNILSAQLKDFMNIPGIGKISSLEIYNFFQEKNNQEIINILIKKIGIFFVEQKNYNQEKSQNIFFKPKEKVVLTGKLKKYSRYNIEIKLKKIGLIVQKNVSKKTTLVIVGRKPSKIKMDKARKFNIKCIYEDELIF